MHHGKPNNFGIYVSGEMEIHLKNLMELGRYIGNS